jgi:hypothetical protein
MFRKHQTRSLTRNRLSHGLVVGAEYEPVEEEAALERLVQLEARVFARRQGLRIPEMVELRSEEPLGVVVADEDEVAVEVGRGQRLWPVHVARLEGRSKRFLANSYL